jgi:hypothetical protein
MISNSSRGKQKFRIEITVLMQHEFFLSADANLPVHPILHAVNNFFNQLTIIFPFVKEESKNDFTSNFGTMKQRIKKFENPMDIQVKLRFFHNQQGKRGVFETSYENYMQQPHEIYNYLKEVEGLVKTETTNIKNRRFLSLFEYLSAQTETTGSRLTQWEKDICKGTKVFNFVLFHRGTVEHVSQQFETLLRELHGKFFKNFLSKMTSFWNFIALGHSPYLVVQRKNFSNLLPGFRLFILEPASSLAGSSPVTPTKQGQEYVADMRKHLT